MPEYPVLHEAKFDPKVKTYYMLRSIVICVVTIVGLVVLPFVIIFGYWLIQKYLDKLSCTLTERTLELRRGILSRVESTIPLEKITDLQMYQGPIMRAMGLYGFKS
jgi:putative membrane protein